MAEIIGKMGEMEKEIRRLRHHIAVLSKRNHRLVEDGWSRAAASIANIVSRCVCEKGEEVAGGVEVAEPEDGVAREVATVEAEGEAEIVARRVAEEEEEEEVAEPRVKLPKCLRMGEKRRRLGSEEVEVVVVKGEEVLIALLGPRAECSGLLRRVGKEGVFREADPR